MKMKTLRQVLPKLEVDWLMPVLLLAVMASASVFEVWTILENVGRLYGMPWGYGLSVGLTVSIIQEIASLLWGDAVGHNRARKVYTSGGEEDKSRSEPRKNSAAPFVVIVAAGAFSAWVNIAGFGADGMLTSLDVALSIVPPLASMSAAVLNGLFAQQEAAIADWHAAQGREKEERQQRANERRQRVEEQRIAEAEAKIRADMEKQREAEKEAQAEFKTRLEQSYHRRAPNWAVREVLDRDGWWCYYCGADMRGWDRQDVHVDHFYPVVHGGSDDPTNLVVSCKGCNLSKNSRIPTDDEIRTFQLHQVKKSGFPMKDKIWIVHHLNLLVKQKDIATELDVSPSYVSTCLGEDPATVSEDIIEFCEKISSVGKPSISLDESDDLLSDEIEPVEITYDQGEKEHAGNNGSGNASA